MPIPEISFLLKIILILFSVIIVGLIHVAILLVQNKRRQSDDLNTKERLKVVFEAAKISDWSYDVKMGEIVALSENMAEIYGLRKEDIALFKKQNAGLLLSYCLNGDEKGFSGNSLLDQVLVNKARRDQALLDAVKEGRSFEIVFEIVRFSDKQHRFLRWQARCEKDRKGVVQKVLGFTQDVTERYAFVESIKESEETFRFLFQSLPIGMAILNKKGQIQRSNRVFSDIAGYSSEELILTNFVTFTFCEDPEKGDKLFREMQNEKRNSIHAKIRFTKKTGDIIYLDARIVAVRNENGSLDFAYGMIEDITEERAMIKQEEILSSSMLMMLKQKDFWDVAEKLLLFLLGLFDADRTFIFEKNSNNSSFSNTFEEVADGIESEKDNLQNLLIKDFPFWGDLLKEGQTIAIDDITTLDPEGSLRQLLESQKSRSVLLVPIFLRNKLWGFWGIEFIKKAYLWKEQDKVIMRNISHPLSLAIEQHLVRRVLMEAVDTARESDRMKSAFLAGMSHEIRTPLNAIVGFSDLIAETIKGSYPEIERFTDIIKGSNTQLLKIIGDMIDFSKIESNTIKISPKTFNLNEFLDSVINENNFAMPEDVSLHLVTPANLYSIETDSCRLRQILGNLIVNAKKFTTEGTITLSVNYDEKSATYLFSVADTGIGIPQDQIEKIFERYVKLNMFTQGTGLGLSIVHSFVGYMGGTIWAESEEGKGSTFFLSIPKEFKELEVVI